jgi:hypothetical protein
MSRDELIDRLLDEARKLHPLQLGLVISVAEILQTRVQIARLPNSDFANDNFMVAFGNRLLIHHAFTYAALTKKHFEHAFEAASLEAGHEAEVVSNATHPGEDLSLNGLKCSLKTEAAASIRDGDITISKLSEARWIQQCTDLEALVEAVKWRIPAQLETIDRMFTLRFFRRQAGVVEYQLVEIPMHLFKAISNLQLSDFSPRTRQGGSTATVQIGDTRIFALRLDGSDGKITISNLKVSQCIIHATWRFVTAEMPQVP